MPDAQLAYSTAQSDRRMAAAERTQIGIDQLTVRYGELPDLLTSVGRSDNGRLPPGPRSPLRTDVQSLIAEIETAAKDSTASAAAELNVGTVPVHGTTRPARTVSRLKVLATWAHQLHSGHPGVASEVATTLWRLNNRAGVILGLASRAFRISERCPDCDQDSLWADPESMKVACGVPDCSYAHDIDAPLLVHATAHTTHQGSGG